MVACLKWRICLLLHINQFLTSYAQHKYVIERLGDGDWRWHLETSGDILPVTGLGTGVGPPPVWEHAPEYAQAAADQTSRKCFFLKVRVSRPRVRAHNRQYFADRGEENRNFAANLQNFPWIRNCKPHNTIGPEVGHVYPPASPLQLIVT